ncbi:mitochondrial 54S ribosomal protein YmL36 [Martiniozyma asiatica (nom. inval.)]|nr:mitochondrial 54S ribosomal protein YmL36 [Martiniozyma asiatica]
MSHLTLNGVRSYAGRVQISAALPKRPLKKIAVGKARPAIYYKFDTLVELSDGSVIKRRSQFPKDEIRMITDQRNSALWNESKPDASLLDAESRGKLNKFKSKFAAFDQSGKSADEVKAEEDKAEAEKQERLRTGIAAKKTDTAEDEFLDFLSENYEDVKMGGNLARKEKKKK